MPTMQQIQDALTARWDKVTDFSGNLQDFYDNANAAAHGDPDSQRQLADQELGAAMGTVRVTPTGRLIGTLSEPMPSDISSFEHPFSGENAKHSWVNEDLAHQAFWSGQSSQLGDLSSRMFEPVDSPFYPYGPTKPGTISIDPERRALTEAWEALQSKNPSRGDE